jgi:hypothetical protein
MAAGLWRGRATLAPPRSRWPEPRIVLNLVAHLVLVSCCFGAAALAAAGWARRRAAAQAPVALAAIALYLLDFLGAWWTALSRVGWISPFHFYQGGDRRGRANTGSTSRSGRRPPRRRAGLLAIRQKRLWRIPRYSYARGGADALPIHVRRRAGVRAFSVQQRPDRRPSSRPRPGPRR